MNLSEAIRLIAEARRLESEMPLPQLHCLLILGEEEEGMSLTEVAKRAGIQLATASRYVSALGKVNRHREEGLKLIESFEDPMERRKKIIRLTTRGKKLIHKMLGDENANLQAR